MYKLGKKSEKVAWSSHNACMSQKKFENPTVYSTCINKWDKEYSRRKRKQRLNSGPLDQTTHKGKTYTASRKCPVGQNMYWSVTSGFMRKTKVSELGCMTKAQNEAFWRDYNLRQAGAPSGGSGAGRAASDRINNQTQRSINNMNRDWQNRYNNWHQKEFGY